ncbi:four helix bundle protein [Imperialibacter roseus]|uniref:Four helix bundle protein n=1 Tax=Imperialibacter roseus TaxID=1324217 RepID=A0ABZ0IQZ0_9BACT|nr:four helix bundle protein [Imperialibacter roseus]WOK06007.1 four helix bundle protein [Imperialibacter roseus]|tara:strand:+ start:84218 stop:84583 length:366 start_codon:yes stop_codon:yes gene_type:complete
MTSEELKDRTFKFSLSILAVFRQLKSTDEGRIIGRQLLRSSSSVAANYRAACRARSKPEFYAKLNIVLEEADESLFWLEYAREGGILEKELLSPYISESLELVKIFSASRSKMRQDKSQNQ